MHRIVLTLAAVAAALTMTVAAAGSISVTAPHNLRYGSNSGTSCNLGSVLVHPVFAVSDAFPDGIPPSYASPEPDRWAYFRLQTTEFDAAACASSWLWVKVGYDSADAGNEPDGHFYLRMDVSEDRTADALVGGYIIGVFADAEPYVCDPFNCPLPDPPDYPSIYPNGSYSTGQELATMPLVADHQLGDVEWIVTQSSTPPSFF